MLDLKTPTDIRERKGTVLVRTGKTFSDSNESLGSHNDIDNDFGSLLADCDDFYTPGQAKKSVDKVHIEEDDPMHEFIHSMGHLNEADVDHTLP